MEHQIGILSPGCQADSDEGLLETDAQDTDNGNDQE